ncbi:MAG: hypothetical protein KDA78_06095 [Planctomycetaceae bacterium]|nr:hypothetical protein [Planctomycetaceae bacterium]
MPLIFLIPLLMGMLLFLTENIGMAQQPLSSFHVLPKKPVDETADGLPVYIDVGQVQHHQPEMISPESDWINPVAARGLAFEVDQGEYLPSDEIILQTSGPGDDFAVVGDVFEQANETQHGVPAEDSCVLETETSWIIWKSTSVTATWVSGSGDDFGMTDVNIGGSITFPKVPFINLSPRYQMTFLDGPQTVDAPETLHRASLGIMGMYPIREKVLGQVVVTPAIASDYRNTGSESLRITGHAMAIFMPSPQLQWVLGVVYLNREDVGLLPAVGVTWSPTEDRRIELMFPRPRALQRIAKDGERETWMYLAAEFGGGSWAVERASGADDVITIRDYRLLAGLEYKLPENKSWFWEYGLVMGREVEYSSQVGNFTQDPSFIIRGGVTF